MTDLSGGLVFPGGIFYEDSGGTVSSDVVPAQFPVAIAGHPYNVEWSLYRLTHLPMRRAAQDDQAEPGEQALDTSGLWRRSQSDWSLGAGQLWLDEQESTRRRFNSSLGIDSFNDRELSLLPATEEKRSSANTNQRLLTVDTRLYVVDGTALIFSNGTGAEQNSTWTTGWTTATGLPGGSILDIAYSGSHVYVLGSDNSIYRATPGTAAFTLYYNPAEVAIRIFTGLGRLFFASDAGQSLFEVTSAGTAETLVFTHPDPNYVLSSLIGTPTGVYFSGNIGTGFGEIRRTVVNTGGTAFDPPVVAAELRNETINVLRTTGMNCVFGTSVGFRYAPLSDQTAGLDFGPAIEVGPVYDIVVESAINNDTGKLDTFGWFTWGGIHEGSESGLGRIRLSRFTEPGVPAYASDIFSAAGGTPIAVASIGGRRYFGISADGFFGATSNFVAEGELRTGRIRYGILDNKVYDDVKWRTDPLTGQVIVDAEFDLGASAHAGEQSAADSVTGTGHLGPVFAEWGELIFTLQRGGVITPALFINVSGTATTPDHADFAITDLDVEITLAADNWNPGGGTTQLIVMQSSVLANVAWQIGLTPEGRIVVSTSPDGSVASTVSFTTTDPVTFDTGSEHTIHVTVDVNNGAGGRTYTIETDGSLFETSSPAGTTSIFNSTTVANIGGAGSAVFQGYVSQMTWLGSIGGAVIANPNFAIQEVADSSFADTAPTPKTWTVNAPAAIALVNEGEALTPRLHWWVLRAIPAVEETLQILVPIRLHYMEQTPNGPAKNASYLDELDFLMSLANTKSVVTYQQGLTSYQVYVNNIEANPEYWNSGDNSPEGIVMVELHTTSHP